MIVEESTTEFTSVEVVGTEDSPVEFSVVVANDDVSVGVVDK